MADSFWASILIGGKVSREQWEAIGAAEDGLEDSEPGDFIHEDGTLYYEDDQATYGRFEELEDYLVEQGIPFTRNSEGFCEYPGETRFFRPGVADLTAYDQEGVGDVMPTAVAMEYIERGLSLADIMALGDEADPSIRLAVLSKDNKLPKFEFVEE